MEAVSAAGRGENIEAPITPGIYEVRIAGSGALHSFDAVDNVAQALALLKIGSKSWFGRRDPATMPDLEYRTCATSSQGRRQGRRRTHDRPPRNLYERRGLIRPSPSFRGDAKHRTSGAQLRTGISTIAAAHLRNDGLRLTYARNDHLLAAGCIAVALRPILRPNAKKIRGATP